MKTVGFPISTKKNEKRRCLIPQDIAKIANKSFLYIEEGYGSILGYSDLEYLKNGVSVCSREEVLKKDIICDPKIGDAEYLNSLKNQVVFGWIHAVQNKRVTDIIIKNNLTAFAWEDMYEDGRHVFYRNNEIAGEAAVFHAYMLHGLFPYDTKVAILGNGNTARGAYKLLSMLGADITLYTRYSEKLFQREVARYDVIVNAVLWDTTRIDHIINKADLKYLKKDALIIDISCDKCGAIESSIPTTFDAPTYVVDGVTHYVVDHTPTLFYKTISESLSEIVANNIDYLITDNLTTTLEKAKIIEKGVVLDSRINAFQCR